MTEEINPADAVANSASGPAKVRVQGMGESEEHPLPGAIAAAKFQMANNAMRKRGSGCIRRKIRKPGSVFEGDRDGGVGQGWSSGTGFP